MAGNQFGGGGEKFQSAQQGLARKVVQLGTVTPQLMAGARIDGPGNVAFATPIQPQMNQAVIGKGDQGVRGATPIRVMGGLGDGFGPTQGQIAQPQGNFHPAPQPQYPPTPHAAPAQPQPSQPQPQHAQLGANEEVHRLVARLQGPSGNQYEAIYEVVAPERGSKVLGVSERPV